jgi:hypothetical protein
MGPDNLAARRNAVRAGSTGVFPAEPARCRAVTSTVSRQTKRAATHIVSRAAVNARLLPVSEALDRGLLDDGKAAAGRRARYVSAS